MIDLASIFRLYGKLYLEKYGLKMPAFHLKTFWDITHCRTSALGGATYFCDHCQEYHYSYHSCGNRNCNKCQNDLAENWLENSKELLLPVKHFLLTFTLPAGLRQCARKEQKLFYSLLLKNAAEALQTLAYDSKYVGGKLGILAILHTWRRDLAFHPHVHIVTPGGGFVKEKNLWLSAKKNYLVPVKALSPIFRAKFRDALKKQCPEIFISIPGNVWQKNWVVHCKAVGDGQHVLKYLAQYVFRPAISNNRILKCTSGNVTFKYKDAKSKTWKFKTLPVLDFISSYLQHVLPRGLVKVRYYGLFSHTNKKTLAKVRSLLNSKKVQPKVKLKNKKILTCPSCGRQLRYISQTRKGEQWINAPPQKHPDEMQDIIYNIWRLRNACSS